MSRVAVKQELLQWAMERSRLSMDEIANKCPKIEEWLSGETKPTLRQLEKFARGTNTPLGFLFLDKPPEQKLPIPHFRTLENTIPSQPSPNLLSTVYDMERRQHWIREYLEEQGVDPLPFVDSVDLSDDVVEVTQRIRQVLGLDELWASGYSTWSEAWRGLREAMEEAGILVVANGVVGNNTKRRLEVEEFRGFVLVDKYAPLVFVNNNDFKTAQMFTLAHELAHIFLGKSAAFDLHNMLPSDDPHEKKCNQIAAEFLVSTRAVKEEWENVKDLSEPFQALARKFKVGVIVAARRALDVELISKNEFIEFYKKYEEDERRQKSTGGGGGDFYNNQNLRVGRKFASVVIQALKEGKLLYKEAYRLTGLKGKTFTNFATKLGFEGV